MRFLADMGISPKTVVFLNSQGYDATHLRDSNLERLADPEVLSKARDEQRILLTHDLDFGELLAASGADLPSVIIFRLQNMRPERVNKTMLALVSSYEEVLTSGAILSITDTKVRLRKLPIVDN
ncbi:MAG: DUF5615 family PIN-like protein [Deinococcota bacterium]